MIIKCFYTTLLTMSHILGNIISYPGKKNAYQIWIQRKKVTPIWHVLYHNMASNIVTLTAFDPIINCGGNWILEGLEGPMAFGHGQGLRRVYGLAANQFKQKKIDFGWFWTLIFIIPPLFFLDFRLQPPLYHNWAQHLTTGRRPPSKKFLHMPKKPKS